MQSSWSHTNPWPAEHLRINSAGRTACPPEWAWRTDTHAWTDLDLWVVLAGQGQVDTPEGRIDVRRGSALLLRGGERYAGHQDHRDRLVVSHTHFDLLTPQASVLAWQHCRSLPPLMRSIHDIAGLSAILDHLLTCWRQHGNAPSSRLWLACALQLLCEQDQAHTIPSSGSELDLMIDTLVGEIESDPGQTLSVAAMAAACHTHPDHFTRRFRTRVGTTPARFLTHARLQRACSLLRYTTLNADQIAHEVGYHDGAHFSRTFANQFGSPPGQWRREQQ